MNYLVSYMSCDCAAYHKSHSKYVSALAKDTFPKIGVATTRLG